MDVHHESKVGIQYLLDGCLTSSYLDRWTGQKEKGKSR